MLTKQVNECLKLLEKVQVLCFTQIISTAGKNDAGLQHFAQIAVWQRVMTFLPCLRK